MRVILPSGIFQILVVATHSIYNLNQFYITTVKKDLPPLEPFGYTLLLSGFLHIVRVRPRVVNFT